MCRNIFKAKSQGNSKLVGRSNINKQSFDEENKEFPISISYSEINTINDLPFEKCYELAYSVAEFCADRGYEYISCSEAIDSLKKDFILLKDLDDTKISSIGDKVESIKDKNNVVFACVLFYIFSNGKYPEDVWGDVSCKRKLRTEDIDPLVGDSDIVGRRKVFEMLGETIIEKYYLYSPMLWKKTIGEFKSKKFEKRCECEFKENKPYFDIYAVSYKGMLDKPGHAECEDCVFVSSYNDTTWLAAEADGMGSCAYADIGSALATEHLSDVISKYLTDNGFIKHEKSHSVSRKRQADKEWSELMYYLRFSLATDFYYSWEEAVKDYNNNIEEFSTTMQFAFGCEKFIACGRVGDGSFYARKNKLLGLDSIGGGFILDDGISGVTERNPMSVIHLKDNPSALQVSFFRPDELNDIIITSDGVSGMIGNDVLSADRFVSEMDGLSFTERCDRLSSIAMKCSDYNRTYLGAKGDDSTIVYINFNKGKTEVC